MDTTTSTATDTATTDRRAAEPEREAATREERFHREQDDGLHREHDDGLYREHDDSRTAGADRAPAPRADGTRDEAEAQRAPAPRPGIDAGTLAAARRRQREEYGGINWGAAFFGFLSAAGLAAILVALVSAAGATLTFGSDTTAGDAAETIGLAGGIALLVALAVSYFAGGYVAGRMSRFDGARQGLGVWLVALAVTVVLAAAGALLGGEYNVLEQLDLPRIPVDEGTIATGAVIALIAAVVGSLIAAMAGGKTGERYHRKVDRLAIDR